MDTPLIKCLHGKEHGHLAILDIHSGLVDVHRDLLVDEHDEVDGDEGGNADEREKEDGDNEA